MVVKIHNILKEIKKQKQAKIPLFVRKCRSLLKSALKPRGGDFACNVKILDELGIAWNGRVLLKCCRLLECHSVRREIYFGLS